MVAQDQAITVPAGVAHHSIGAFASLHQYQAFQQARRVAQDTSSVTWSSCRARVYLPLVEHLPQQMPLYVDPNHNPSRLCESSTLYHERRSFLILSRRLQVLSNVFPPKFSITSIYLWLNTNSVYSMRYEYFFTTSYFCLPSYLRHWLRSKGIENLSRVSIPVRLEFCAHLVHQNFGGSQMSNGRFRLHSHRTALLLEAVWQSYYLKCRKIVVMPWDANLWDISS